MLKISDMLKIEDTDKHNRPADQSDQPDYGVSDSKSDKAKLSKARPEANKLPDDAHASSIDDAEKINYNNEVGALKTVSSDTQLLSQIAKGDRLAARSFIDRHINFVVNVCKQRLQNHAKAEEAAQEVFLTIWRNAGQWEERQAKVTSWLYRIAYNKSIDILRREKPSVDIDQIDDPVDPSDDAERLFQVSEDQQALQIAVKRLTPDQRRAIELVYFAELKQAEAARQMEMTLAALESVLRRARQALHAELSHTRNHLTLI